MLCETTFIDEFNSDYIIRCTWETNRASFVESESEGCEKCEGGDEFCECFSLRSDFSDGNEAECDPYDEDCDDDYNFD